MRRYMAVYAYYILSDANIQVRSYVGTVVPTAEVENDCGL